MRVGLRVNEETFTLGETIWIEIGFEGETPTTRQASLALTIGERTRVARQVFGTSFDMRFEYTVQLRDRDADGFTIPENALTLDDDPTTEEPVWWEDGSWGDPQFRVDGSVSAPPKISDVYSTSTPRRAATYEERVNGERQFILGDTYKVGEAILIAVAFDKAVSRTGRPQLRLQIGDSIRYAEPDSRTVNTPWEAFSYIVTPEDVDADGIAVPANAITLNGGAISLAGDPTTAAALRHEGLAIEDLVDGRRASPPRAASWGPSSVALWTGPPQNGESYASGEAIRLLLQLDRRVEVRGTPELELEIGGKTRRAPLETVLQRGRTVYLYFQYTVQSDDPAESAFTIPPNALRLERGGVTLVGHPGEPLEPFGGASDTLPFGVDGSASFAPGVDYVYIDGLPRYRGSYGLGDAIHVKACLPYGAVISGTPSVSLRVGGNTRQANYDRFLWRPTNCHDFSYVVQADDLEENGVYLPAAAIRLNEGAVFLEGNPSIPVDLTHEEWKSVDGRDRLVAGSVATAPRVTSVSFAGRPRGSGVWSGPGEKIPIRVAFDKALAIEGEPSISLNVGGQTRQASLASHGPAERSSAVAENHFALFEYAVRPEDVDTDGISVPANALSLNGGSMTLAGATGTAADLSHSAVNPDPTRLVDGVAMTGNSECDPWAPEWAGNAHVFEHGYRVSACVEYRADGETVRRVAADYGLDSRESALLWFFDRDNVEILVKVLDACGVNGHRWVFVAPVTDLAFNLEVVEEATGKRWRYRNAAGRTAETSADTAAFPCDAAAASWAGAGWDGPVFPSPGNSSSNESALTVPPLARASDAGPETDCEPAGPAMTLEGGYTVSMCYETEEGTTGDARDFGLDSSSSGLLWFFDRNNVEVLVKVLDGCAINGHRWVYAAPVTNLAFNLHVESPDGKRWTHRNRLGRKADAASDLSFFGCEGGS